MCVDCEVGDAAAANLAFSRAAHVVRLDTWVQRVTGVTMEPRAILANYNPSDRHLTVWHSTQVPYMMQCIIARHFGLPESGVRVVAPDVGGGFGVKGQLFPEEAVLCAVARILGRPIKWIETRREHLSASIHSREHHYDV